MSLALSSNALAQRTPVAMDATRGPRSVRPVAALQPTRPGRREALGYLATVLTGGALLAAPKAEALAVPFQDSILGGESTNTSEQSMLAYDMEGIKKAALTKKEKKKLLAELRERSIASAGK